MNKLVVIFPGIGYTSDRPLLHYSLQIAREVGFRECKKIAYSTANKENIRGDLKAMEAAFNELYKQTEEQLSEIDWDSFDDVLFISKSIGTIVASAYARKNNLKQVRHILYTPLTYTFDYRPSNSIAFIGTDDGWSRVQDVVRMSSENYTRIEVYEDCNHSLELEDAMKNIENLNDIMSKTKSFLSQNEGNRRALSNSASAFGKG